MVQARKRQGSFLAAIGYVFNDDIMMLDLSAQLEDKSKLPMLRKMLSNITSFQQGMEHLPLFHRVDAAYGRDGNTLGGYCFLIMPHL